MAFTKFGLSPRCSKASRPMGYVEPTPIQLRAIPLDSRGAGRHRQRPDRHGQDGGVRAANPLAARPARARRRACWSWSRRGNWPRRWKRPSTISPASPTCAPSVIFGGVGYGRQMDALKNGVDIIVATPGPAARSSATGHLPAGPCPVPRAGRSGPDAGHGVPARRAPHRRKMPPRPAHLALLRHHPAGDRNAHPMGDEESADHRDRRAPHARRTRSSMSFTPWPTRRRPICCSNCSSA